MILHDICDCDTVRQYDGDWSTPDARRLIQDFSTIQLRSGLYAAWSHGLDNLIEVFTPESPEYAEGMKRAKRAELPLMIFAEGSILFDKSIDDSPSDTTPEETAQHFGFEYGLTKISPENGEPFPDSSIWVADIATHKSGVTVDVSNGNFSEAQIQLFERFSVAFRQLGLIVPDISFSS